MPNVEELSAVEVDIAFKDGVRRLVNNHQNFASLRLRANKNFAITT
jgi:hypothetical protein